jgi:glycosyltransferase involved in cell wall biosynthesis
MKIACIIPTYNFVEGVKRISHWITNEYHFLAAEQKIVIVDDGSDHRYVQDFERLNKLENFTVVKSRGRQSLREAILTGYDEVKDWKQQLDINPNLCNLFDELIGLICKSKYLLTLK